MCPGMGSDLMTLLIDVLKAVNIFISIYAFKVAAI
jgi:hypothetical protein